MNQSKAEMALERGLAPQLDLLGFRLEETLFFSKNLGEAIASIGVPVRRDEKGVFNVSYLAGLRYPAIKALVSPGADTYDDAIYAGAMIVAPHHLFLGGRRYFEWPFSNQKELEEIIPMIVKNVKEAAIPYWEAFGTLAKLRVALADGVQPPYLALSAEQFICLRSALLALGNDVNGAVSLLEMGITDRIANLPKKRRPLQKLLTILRTGMLGP